MPFDDLPILSRIMIGVLAPLLVAIFCWVAGPRLAGPKRTRTRARSWVEFWLLLIAAYLISAIALWGSRFFAPNDRVDPSSQVVQ